MKLEIKQNGIFSDRYYTIDTKDVRALSVEEGFFTSYKIKLYMNDGRVIKLSTDDIDNLDAFLNQFNLTIN